MNNQAAQTMPEIPQPSVIGAYYVVADMESYGRACYAAALSQTAGVVEPLPMDSAPRDGTMVRLLVNFTDHATEDTAGPAWTIGAYPSDDESGGWQFAGWCWTHDHFTEGEGTPIGWLPMLAAAPAASGGEDYSACCDTPAYCSSVRRCTAKDSPPSAASVSERARELLAAEYRTHGWHEDAGRLCMGGDPASFVEDDALRAIERLIEQGDEDNHVITELGRLLAGIAVILKGPEPAGTAWSYHDLPALVASEVAEPRQVAAEMKAWAHTKMADQQSSRRDRMMVAEWAKRLLPESSFPVKDFDVEGMSIPKEAAREAVKRVALEQALTQQRGTSPSDGAREAVAAGYAVAEAFISGRNSHATVPEPNLYHDTAGVPLGHDEWGRQLGVPNPKHRILTESEYVMTAVRLALLTALAPVAITPQPGAEALLVPRDLVSDARDWVRAYADAFDCPDEDPTMEVCRVARELESLLGRGG